MEKLHDKPSCLSIKHVLTQAFTVFEKEAFERLFQISLAQIYNLLSTDHYHSQRVQWSYKRPHKAATLGVLKAPMPEDSVTNSLASQLT